MTEAVMAEAAMAIDASAADRLLADTDLLPSFSLWIAILRCRDR
jgi:hypothetical protein